MEHLIITPRTKIYDLLEAYPQLEDTLIEMAPEFKKLKNPLLRKTIAKVANLSQAATIGGLNIETLVNTLREKAGQSKLEQIDIGGTRYVTSQPDWFNINAITEVIDIREMLNHGEQPVHEVLSSLNNLSENHILEVTAPFIPAPLLDKSLSLGCLHWVNRISDNEYKVYFKKSAT